MNKKSEINSYDFIVIGAGPAGYVAAIRGGQMGLKTALIDKEFLGGMCLNWGCIPTKSLLESARLMEKIKAAKRFGIEGIQSNELKFNWKKATQRARQITKRLTMGIEKLLTKNAVDFISGEAKIISPNQIGVNGRTLKASTILVATGSIHQKRKHPIPEEMMIQVRELLTMQAIPSSIVVLGTGANALELSQLLRRAGSNVSLVLTTDELLPDADPFLSNFALKRLKKDRIQVYRANNISGIYNGGIVAGDKKIPCKKIINSERRLAVIPPSEIKIETKGGFIEVDEYLRTNIPTILAAGDANGRSNLAHAASAQGLKAANIAAGIREKVSFENYPLNIYSFPEIAQIGKTEPQLKKEGIKYKVSEFPLSANGKALIQDESEGFIRLLSDWKFGEVLGVQIVAPNATDLISEAAAVMQMEGTIYDITRIVHAHPTISEVFTEVGFAAIDKAVHI